MNSLEAARQALRDALVAGADTRDLRDVVRRLESKAASSAAAESRAIQKASRAVAAEIATAAAALVEADSQRRQRWLSQFYDE
jgi:hypothetical protein